MISSRNRTVRWVVPNFFSRIQLKSFTSFIAGCVVAISVPQIWLALWKAYPVLVLAFAPKLIALIYGVPLAILCAGIALSLHFSNISLAAGILATLIVSIIPLPEVQKSDIEKVQRHSLVRPLHQIDIAALHYPDIQDCDQTCSHIVLQKGIPLADHPSVEGGSEFVAARMSGECLTPAVAGRTATLVRLGHHDRCIIRRPSTQITEGALIIERARKAPSQLTELGFSGVVQEAYVYRSGAKQLVLRVISGALSTRFWWVPRYKNFMAPERPVSVSTSPAAPYLKQATFEALGVKHGDNFVVRPTTYSSNSLLDALERMSPSGPREDVTEAFAGSLATSDATFSHVRNRLLEWVVERGNDIELEVVLSYFFRESSTEWASSARPLIDRVLEQSAYRSERTCLPDKWPGHLRGGVDYRAAQVAHALIRSGDIKPREFETRVKAAFDSDSAKPTVSRAQSLLRLLQTAVISNDGTFADTIVTLSKDKAIPALIAAANLQINPGEITSRSAVEGLIALVPDIPTREVRAVIWLLTSNMSVQLRLAAQPKLLVTLEDRLRGGLEDSDARELRNLIELMKAGRPLYEGRPLPLPVGSLPRCADLKSASTKK